jgi:hypothetical protein
VPLNDPIATSDRVTSWGIFGIANFELSEPGDSKRVLAHR